MTPQPLKLSVIGLPGAGKTSVVHRLKYNTFLQRPKPTIGVSAEIVDLGGFRLVLWDVGGHALHALWQQYRKGTKGILYIIDAANEDSENQSEDQENLKIIIDDDYLENISIAILVNKIDIADSSNKEKILESLALVEKPDRVKIFQTSAKTGEGLKKALAWIDERITLFSTS